MKSSSPNIPADIAALEDAFDAIEADARALVNGLAETLGAWRIDAAAWSVAECLDHLAIANRAYLRAMEPVAERSSTQGSARRGPATPGVLGSSVVRRVAPQVAL